MHICIYIERERYTYIIGMSVVSARKASVRQGVCRGEAGGMRCEATTEYSVDNNNNNNNNNNINDGDDDDNLIMMITAQVITRSMYTCI